MNSLVAPFEGLVLPSGSTVRAAMAAIDANWREVVLVQDETGRIVGLITDGDIRRGLLRGLTLESPANDVVTRNFVSVGPDLDRASVLDLMKARTIRHVPVLDAGKRLLAIHFLRDLIGGATKPNVAVIMAGGKGTRLRPLTQTVPKPMVPVAGRPILERIVLHLVGHGIQHIYLAVNYMAEMIEAHFGDGAGFGCRISYLRETKPLGSGGALSLLPRPIDHPVLVLNGDLVTHLDVTGILESHLASGCNATIGTGSHQLQIPFAVVTERGGRLLAIEEKPRMSVLINQGFYVLDPATIDEIPPDREYPITNLFESLIEAKRSVNVYYSEASWMDIGRPEDLRRAHGS